MTSAEMERYADEIDFIKGLGKQKWTPRIVMPRSELLSNYIEGLKLNMEYSDDAKRVLREVAMQELKEAVEKEAKSGELSYVETQQVFDPAEV